MEVLQPSQGLHNVGFVLSEKLNDGLEQLFVVATHPPNHLVHSFGGYTAHLQQPLEGTHIYPHMVVGLATAFVAANDAKLALLGEPYRHAMRYKLI